MLRGTLTGLLVSCTPQTPRETVETAIAHLGGQYTIIIIVTHNLAQARRLADRLAVFWWVDGAGQLIELGATADLFNQLSHPLTQAYLSGRRG